MSNIVERDRKHIWHPCSQMKDFEQFAPVPVVGAKGNYIQLANGRKVIDAISSWWCKPLGHGHSRLRAALLKQVDQFEHVMLGNTTHEVIVELSEQLAELTLNLKKVLFASDGACAVEMALKMAVHAQQLKGQTQRTELVYLENAYHGETALTLSVSDKDIYKKAYHPLLTDAHCINGLPYVSGCDDPLWKDCSDYWPNIETQLNAQADTLAALIIEPIVQGAGNMRIYSADLLTRLRQWCDENSVLLIADEIMTGLGRTGLPLACNHAGIEPDMLCLGKSLTGGWLPMSAMLTSDHIFNLFYDDYEHGKNFLHSHTHSGNALAAAVANETLKVIQDENIVQAAKLLEPKLLKAMQRVADATGQLKNVRCIGGIVAADLNTDKPRQGYKVFQKAMQLGAFLRPLGNTIYWFPPLNIDDNTLGELTKITIEAIITCQMDKKFARLVEP
tara:strand:+ start:1116 stop:2456 length:1341 start_codon:yes stop_codon:yes gene_type:complete